MNERKEASEDGSAGGRAIADTLGRIKVHRSSLAMGLVVGLVAGVLATRLLAPGNAALQGAASVPSTSPAEQLAESSTAVGPSTTIGARTPSTTPVVSTAALVPSTSTSPATIAPQSGSESVAIAVPAYFAPATWTLMTGAPGATPIARLAVLNPASGAGLFRDDAVAKAVDAARMNGIRVLGYVATGYGAAVDVQAHIDAYRSLYGVQDIFFDEVATDCVKLATVYAPWIASVRGSQGFVAVNPGQHSEACWGDAADLVVSFEGRIEAYRSYQPARWMLALPPSKFWHIVYGVPVSGVDEVRATAQRTHAGWLYATSDDLPNPYDTLPPWLLVGSPEQSVLILAPPVPTPDSATTSLQ